LSKILIVDLDSFTFKHQIHKDTIKFALAYEKKMSATWQIFT